MLKNKRKNVMTLGIQDMFGEGNPKKSSNLKNINKGKQ